MCKETIIKDIEKYKIIVILRGYATEELVDTITAMEKAGIKLVEITFDQSGKIPNEQTANQIKQLSTMFKGRVRLGAGTVMTEEQVVLAYNAGAEYIISPDCYEPVIRKTVELGMVSIPGVFTATEAANAHRFGADFVKLFPNSEMKPSYLKALIAPLSHIKFLAVGGVNQDNMKEYFANGAVGIGVATAIANREYIKNGQFDKITELATLYTSQL